MAALVVSSRARGPRNDSSAPLRLEGVSCRPRTSTAGRVKALVGHALVVATTVVALLDLAMLVHAHP